MQTPRFLDRTTPPHIVTLVLIAGLSALNMNIFLPALPAMARGFDTSYATIQLTLSGYLTGTAILQLLLGPLSDRFGRRPVLIASLAIFLVATVVCILAPSIQLFLAGRFVQTTLIAGLVLSRAIVRDMVPMEEAASMIGYVTMGMTIVPMVGPVLGGLLVDVFPWQSTFVLVFAFGLAVLAVVWLDLKETNRNRPESFAAQFHAYPALLGSGRFWAYTLTTTFASGVFFSFLGGAPFVGTVLLDMTPTALGLWFFPIAFGYMVGNYVSGRHARHLGIGTMMLSGGLIALAGTLIAAAFFLSGHASPLTFFGPMVLIGVGNGVALPSANAGIVSVRPELAGSASGLGGALTIGGGAALSALSGAVLSVETGIYPLLAIMAASSLLGILACLFVLSPGGRGAARQ
ncbi:multidrug effflux MFS transporter [Ensifer soli]|uniref:multidrug effflux MFS transporter n=1 Tax=Ciceribacter sp. sgz301302 TaxID=3342379 RepID=UPI0035BB2290